MKRFEPFQNVYSLLIRLLIKAQSTKDIETKIQFPAKDHVSTSFSNESHFFPGGFDSSAMSQQQTMATQNVLHNLPPALAGIIMIKHAPACFPHASILCQICHSGNPIPPDYVLQLLTYVFPIADSVTMLNIEFMAVRCRPQSTKQIKNVAVEKAVEVLKLQPSKLCTAELMQSTVTKLTTGSATVLSYL